ncbi:MAG: GumC family protein, partial [Panacagrimonas sp.]
MPPPPPVPALPESADPLRQFRILYRNKWQILRTLAAVLLVATLGVFAVAPTYRGTATLLIEAVGAKVVAIDEVYQPGIPGVNLTEYQNTQIEVLKSRTIAERVFVELKLEQYPEYALSGDAPTGFLAELKALLRPSAPADDRRAAPLDRLMQNVDEVLPGSPPPADGGHAAAVDQLMDNIEVEPVTRSNLVKVHAEAETAELSAKIANAVVNAYISYDAESRSGIANEASGWLGQQLAAVKADLERAEQAQQKFYESQALVNVGGARGLVEDEITDNASQLRAARNTRAGLENVYRRIVSARNSVEVLQEIPQIAQEPLVQATKKLFIEAQGEVGALQSRYGPKHPKMAAAQARLNDARGALRTQVLLAADGIRSQYEIARNTETSLAGIVQESRSQIQGLDRKENQLQILQREVESNRKLYDTLLQRSKETQVTGELDIGKIRVIETAIVPKDPFKPRKLLWLATAGLSGLFLGLALALLRGFLDDTIKTPLDLEQAALIPALTVLPKVKGRKRLTSIEIDEPNAMFSEGIRTLRTSLLLSDMSRKRKRILVTSAVPGEGKTSVALNLAMAIGQVERVLLVDADLRKPTVGTRLLLPPDSKGIVDLFTGTADLQACIHRHAKGNIDVLSCCRPPPNPLELIGSDRFAQLLESLGERYDRVVIDSPPCQPVSDSLL